MIEKRAKETTAETAGVSEGRRVFAMNEAQAAAFDLLQDFGLPATLDALSSACRAIAKWHREDREPKYAVKFERFANKLHQLSLDAQP